MTAASLTVATDGSCTGTIQVSGDGFNTCVAMTSASPVFFAGNTFAGFTAQGKLLPLTNYRIRVTTAALDSFGFPMAGRNILRSTVLRQRRI